MPGASRCRWQRARHAERGVFMPTREIPLEEWQDFVESFTRQHESWLVELEIFNGENGQQISSRNLHLKSVTAEPAAANEPKKMIVIVGEDGTNGVGQLIRKLSRVANAE